MTDALYQEEAPGTGLPGSSLTDAVLSLEDSSVGDTIATGFEPLDQALSGGLRTRDLAVVAGVPGIGKTIVTLQWARNMAVLGYRAAYLCYEHDEHALAARLLSLEVGEASAGDFELRSGPTLAAVKAVALSERRLKDEVDVDPLLLAAVKRMEAYSDRLQLIRGSGVHTGLDEIEEIAKQLKPGAALFVDYLQKIPVTQTGWTDSERSIRQAEVLKEMAMEYDIAIVAVVAAEREGLQVRRLRPHQLRGASGLAYEADLILILNEKYLAVSKRHSAYDPVQAETFHRSAILTIEKNRSGQSGLDLEFVKDFAHFRFHPRGKFVEEQLIDDLMFPE